MEVIAVLLIVPGVLFLVIIAPLWMILHYASKRKLTKQLSDSEQIELEGLIKHTQTMTQRIATLEAILDAQTPNWRTRVEEES